jgi:preprotein translocase subunit SecE
MSNQRVVGIGYAVLAILSGMFIEHLLLAGFSLSAATQPLTRPLMQSDAGGTWSYSSFIGLALAGGVAAYLWSRQPIREASFEIAAELRKVTWPSLIETRAATIAVIVASLVAAALLGLFDAFWQFLTDQIQNPSL